MLLSGWLSDLTGERCLHASGGAVLAAAGCAGAALLPSPGGRVAAPGIALVNTIFSLGGFNDATGSTSGAFLVLTAFRWVPRHAA
jgi:hypothetical protein